MSPQRAQIKVPSLKVTLPLKPQQLPADLVPADGPAGEPVIEIHLEGAPTVIHARVNGKNYRRMQKTIAENGAENVVVVLQGALKPGPQSGFLALESAGFSVQVKQPKTEPTAE